MVAKSASVESPAYAARHCLDEIPYRMIVFERMNQRTPLYRVAGSDKVALNAENALREAFRIHGGECLYCRKRLKAAEFTLDHVETVKAGSYLQNLVIACEPCNKSKANKRIEAFNPEAGREWLSALLLQVQDRLNRL